MEPVDAVQEAHLHQPEEIACVNGQNESLADGCATGQAKSVRNVSDAEFKRYLEETLRENHRLLAKLAE